MAAAEILAGQGSAALTHRTVASRAGVSLGSTTQYFKSIDDLRETALQILADEIDTTLTLIDRELRSAIDPIDRCIAMIHKYLLDRQQLEAWMALTTAAAIDPNLRPLARRWTKRLTEILTPYMNREQAVAIQVYLDGATVHTVLHDRPPSRTSLGRTVKAILAGPGGPVERPDRP